MISWLLIWTLVGSLVSVVVPADLSNWLPAMLGPGEILVNTDHRPGDQNLPSVSCFGNQFVVSYSGEYISKGTFGVAATWLDAGKDVVRRSLAVDPGREGEQWSASVVVGEEGAVAVWADGQGDDDGYGVRMRRVAHSGDEPAVVQLVNDYQQGGQWQPVVARLVDRSLVVVWSSFFQDDSGFAVASRWFEGDLIPRGREFLVNQHLDGSQMHPAVAPLSGGGFAVAWESEREDGGREIRIRYFTVKGNTTGEDRSISLMEEASHSAADIACISKGRCMVVWQALGADGDGLGVYGRCLGGDGVPTGGAFRVSGNRLGDQQAPAVTSVDGKGYLVVWSDSGGEGDGAEVRARSFWEGCQPTGPEQGVNTFRDGWQSAPDVAVCGDFAMAVWQSQGSDRSGWGIVGRWLSMETFFPGTP